jgi:tRNA threonylcarbamoyladenosine biosynthesis protein TsaE
LTAASRVVLTHSEEQTASIGRELGASVGPGSVVLLCGDLGAGKTAFARGLAEGLGIPPSEVSSPTFTIIQEYRRGRLPLFHVDLYRLNDPREIDDLGLDEIAQSGVLVIEWAEKLPEGARLTNTDGVVSVRIDYGDGDERHITVASHYSER